MLEENPTNPPGPIDEGKPTYADVLAEHPDMHPELRRHVERLAAASDESHKSVAVAPEAHEIGHTALAEHDSQAERTEFTDSRGVVRRPHELSAEIIVTDEVAQVVDEHFSRVYSNLDKLDKDLDELEQRLANSAESRRQSFNPIDQAFFDRIKVLVSGQMDAVSEDRPTTKDVEVEKKGLFGRKKLFTQTVEATEKVAVDGYVQDFSQEEKRNLGEHRNFQYKDRELRGSDGEVKSLSRAEARDRTLKSLQTTAEKLLCDDTYDPHERSRQKKDGTRLPLLAKRLFDAGLEPDSLDEATLYKLVPELGPVKTAIEQIRDVIDDTIVTESFSRARSDIHRMLPDGQYVSSIFYSDSDFAEIAKRYDRLLTILAANAPEKIGNQDEQYAYWPRSEKLLEEARGRIEQFFTHTVRADELLFHGTPFAPRLIKSGLLKPSASMTEEEFTFNTPRKYSDGTQEGSNGVHWAGIERITYDDNLPADGWLGKERLHHYEVEDEMGKGGVGRAVLGMRLGDIVRAAPYGGYYTQSAEWDRKKAVSNGGTPKFVIIQLTGAGYSSVADKLGTNAKIPDACYTAAPGSADKDAAFNYSFPVKSALVAIGSNSKEEVLAALHEAGWTEEEIAQQTFIFSDPALSLSDVPQQMQAKANEASRYQRAVVGLLANEL